MRNLALTGQPDGHTVKVKVKHKGQTKMALRADDSRFRKGVLEQRELERPHLSLISGLMPNTGSAEKIKELPIGELFLEVSEAANGILDDYKAQLLAEAYADYYKGEPDELINHLVISSALGLRYETRYMPGDSHHPSYRGVIADFARVPRKGFPRGIPSSLGGGVFAVETFKEEWVDSKFVETPIEQFFVVPPRLSRRWRIGGRRWSYGMLILPGLYSVDDPNTVVLDGQSQRQTRLPQGSNGSVMLGQPCTDENEIRRLLKLAEDVCWSARQKMSHSEFDD